MKNWSNEKKKRLVYIVTALLISAIVIVVIANLGIIKSSANDLEDYPIEYYPLREYDFFNEYTNTDLNKTTNGNQISYTLTNNISRISQISGKSATTYYIFIVCGDINIDDTPTYIQIYANPQNVVDKEVLYEVLDYNKSNNINYRIVETTFSVNISSYNYEYLIKTGGNYEYQNIETNPLDITNIIITTNYHYGALIAQYYCDNLNNIDITPEQSVSLNQVIGTSNFIKTENNLYNHYTINNIIPLEWIDFYAGFIGRVQAADGTSVPIYYNWAVDGLQYGDGTITVLDPAYHDYITEINITGSITNGTIELDASKEIEIVYFAISGNYNNLSTHLVEKVNEYQLAADQIQDAYNEGYRNGYTDGVNITQMGAFGNAELKVYFQFVEDSTGTVINQLVNFPFNVNTGGISFENVWTWYMNSEWNRSGISVYYVDFEIILYDTGVLWSNTMFRFGVEGDTITSDMMPYSVQVATVETIETSQTTGIWHNVSLTKTGDYYYLTNDELEGYHVDQIRFYINTQNLSYYDQLITNKLTLYNNLGEYTMNVKSFNAGYNNGYDVGYINGEKDGIATQQTLSFNEGKAAGFVEGKEVGYTNGYSDGMRDDFKFYELFFSLFDAQLNTFKSVVSFEIFGINVAGFVLGLVTIGIVAFVIKKVW